MADFGGGDANFYRRSQSQTRHEFPSFHSSQRGLNPPPPPLHSTQQFGHQPPAPYSSTSLGPTFRSRSLDHRRFPAFTSSTDQSGGERTIYTSQQIGGGGMGYRQKYTGELFGGGGVPRKAPNSASTHYRSNSTEKSGVTVVPIRREATLPARRFQSEWKNEWKSGAGGFGFGGPSLIQQQIAEQQQKEEDGAKEEYQFERSSKFSQNKQAWNKPKENFYDRWHRMEIIEAPKSVYYPADSNADYSIFRRNQQMGGGDSAAQHQQNQQHTRTQQHERQYREWHSGGRNHQRSAGATRAAADHYGTLGTRRSATERHGHRGTGAAYQQQQQHQYREGGTYGGGGGEGGHRYQNYRQHEQHYANGWPGGGGGGGHQHQQYHHQQQHMRRSASAGGGGGGLFGTGRKSKSSKSSGARWSNQRTSAAEQRGGPKRYRKIRLCCFNLIWPPWAVEPSSPPKSYYGRSKASGPPTPIPLEHRPFYSPAEGPISPPQQQQQGNPGMQQTAPQYNVPPPQGTTQHPQVQSEMTRGYPRGPPGVPEPPEYRAPPQGGGGMDVPDYRRGGERGPPPPQGPDPHFQHSRELGRELPVRHEQPSNDNRWPPPRRGE